VKLHLADDEVLVRPVDIEADIPELTAMLHRAYRELADLGFQYVASFQEEDVTRRRAAKGTCLVAVSDGRLVGTITLYDATQTAGCRWYDRIDVGHFGQFAVDPSFRSRGLGSALLDLVEARAADLGIRELALNTAEGVAHLIHYYERRGYRWIEHIDWGINYASVILSKTVSRSMTPSTAFGDGHEAD